MISFNLIKFAFDDDKNIGKFCDPDYKDKPVNQLTKSIYKKLLEYEREGNSKFDDLNVDNEIVGYAFYFKNLLVSFGINKNHRTKYKLSKVFEQIKGNFDSDFESYMWERNERAIKWLKKCGMVEVPSNIDNVVKLKYILCQ
jgi:hypothetical protein